VGGPRSGETAWSPIGRKRVAPYAENGWSTIGRKLTVGESEARRAALAAGAAAAAGPEAVPGGPAQGAGGAAAERRVGERHPAGPLCQWRAGALLVVDEYTRECLVIVAARRLSAEHVDSRRDPAQSMQPRTHARDGEAQDAGTVAKAVCWWADPPGVHFLSGYTALVVACRQPHHSRPPARSDP
jgi:hypothetical protein